MLRRYLNFVRGVGADWVGRLGISLTTAAFLVFLFLELMRILGVLTNAYVGLVTYLLLPALFVLGLLLVPLGWRRARRRFGLSSRELAEARFGRSAMRPGLAGASVFGVIALLTGINLVFLGGGTARMLHFMDQPRFCGTACHGVMIPEWTTYQASPHAHVHCVECHVGEGFRALVDSKISGLRQLVSVTFDLHERPIPTPVRELRPARETCERCHWPDRFYGDRIKTWVRHEPDSASTPRYTTLALKIGSGRGAGGEIHWHVAAGNEVRYASVDDERREMAWVELRLADGGARRFVNRRVRADAGRAAEVRVLDCVDCHNRATHIYEDPERGVDERLARGELDRSLPGIKAAALAAVLPLYADAAAAERGVATGLRAAYARERPDVLISRAEDLDRAAAVLQAMHRRNVHHAMRVGWNSYPDHRGHADGGGCFRCHDADLRDETGAAVPHDCTLCHSILAQDSPLPFEYLSPAAADDPERLHREALRREFLERTP